MRKLHINIVKYAGTDHGAAEISGSKGGSYLALHVIGNGKWSGADEAASGSEERGV